MANICQNLLLIVGHEEDIIAVKEHLKNDNSVEYVFNPIEKKEVKETVPLVLSNDKVVYIPDRYKGEYSYNKWGYNYERLMFGTKWGFFDSCILSYGQDYIVYGYNSAWAEPYGLIRRLSIFFPQVLFYNTVYGVESGCVAAISFLNGKPQEFLNIDIEYDYSTLEDDNYDIIDKDIYYNGEYKGIFGKYAFIFPIIINIFNETLLNIVLKSNTTDPIKIKIEDYLISNNNWIDEK
mgnify:CR=1 FL=1